MSPALLAISLTMARTAVCVLLPLLLAPSILTLPPPQDHAALSASDPLSGQAANMNVSSLGGALFLLSSMYISLVHPDNLKPKVSMQFIFPDISIQKKDLGDFEAFFRTEMRSSYRDFGSLTLMANTTWTDPAPSQILHALCNVTFPANVVTVLHINNPDISRAGSDQSRYLQQLLQSIGIPVISWDAEFSFSRQYERTLQLAPTMFHQTQAMLAFLRKFSWSHFTIVTTDEVGSEDFVTALRNQEQMSKHQPPLSRDGKKLLKHEILSEVILKNGDDKDVIRQQLQNEVDPDTRIILLHSASREAFNIMEVAQELGLTSREYVWILTARAAGDKQPGERASRSLPRGLFALSYKTQIEDMQPVMRRAIKVWMTALSDMHRAGQAETWQWNTQLSCTDLHLKSWAGGQLLFDYMRNVTLDGEGDDVATAFNDTGMVLYNKISILNVADAESVLAAQSSAGNAGARKPGAVGGSSLGVRRPTSSFGNRFGSSSGSSSPFGSSDRLESSSDRFGSSSDRFGSSSSLSSANRMAEQNSSSSPFGSRSPFSRDKTSSPFNGVSVRGPSRFGSRTGGFQPSSRRTFGRDGSDANTGGNGDDDTSDTAGADGKDTMTEEEKSPSTTTSSWGQHEKRSRRKKLRRHLIRHHRLDKRAIPQQDIFQEVGTWDGRELKLVEIAWPGNSSFPPKGFPETYHLDVATYIEAPHVTFQPLPEKGICGIHSTLCQVYDRDDEDKRNSSHLVTRCCLGLSIDLLDKMSQHLNFNYSLFEVDTVGYGSQPTNASETRWTGLVGALQAREADLVMAALSITKEREDVIDFSVPFLETGITIVVAIREGAISPTAFLEPYDYPSWTLILVFSVHATGASIFIFEWLSPYGLDQGKTPLRVHKFSLFRSFWLIWAMLFGAAVSTDMPRGVSSRFLANIWALFAVVFLASYTANLAAFMITKEEYYDLSGIEDWRLKNPHHRHPPFKYATMERGATETNIQKNYPKLYAYMKNYPQQTVKEAVKALKEQKIQAFIYDATTLEYAVGRDPGCKLKSVGKRYAETGYGVGFPKGSRWVKKFDKVLLKMQDDGDIERLQKYWLAGACHKKSQQRGTSSHTLGILNFTSAFILLGGGVVLGSILLFLEHFYFRFGRKSLRKWDKCGCCSLVSLSMGQSLTFEQSVMEAIDMQKHHKCKDPLCETQLWKAKHELDIALLKIDHLKRQLARKQAAEAAANGDNAWTLDPETAAKQQDGIPRKRIVPSPTAASQDASHDPILAKERERANGVETLRVGTPSPPPPPPPPPPPNGTAEMNFRSLPTSPDSDSDHSPPPRTAKRTRVNGGKIYENVDGGIDIESTI